MKHKTLRCTAETAALLLTVAMPLPDCIITIRTGCFPPLIPAGIS